MRLTSTFKPCLILCFLLVTAGASRSQTIVVRPHRATMDESVFIAVNGSRANRPAIVRASMIDGAGRVWESQQQVSARERSVSATRLLMSMRARGDSNGIVRFEFDWRDTLRTVFTLEFGDSVIATDTIARTFLPPGIAPMTVRDHGIVATLFTSTDPTPRPAVLVIGGSEGGESGTDVAAQLARHGFTTMSLAYFGMNDLPNSLDRIPLEYFENALAVLAGDAHVRPDRIAILGTSKGAEAALLIATRSSAVRAVVAYAPSSVAWSCICDTATHSSWTLAGRDIPAVGPGTDPTYHPLSGVSIEPVRNYLYRLRTNADSDAIIPVERIRAPFLLVAGDDDRLWPSAMMARAIEQRLSPQSRKAGSGVLIYKNAGHLIPKSILPSGSTKIARGRIETGGTTEGNARAGRVAWPEVVKFLSRTLGLKSSDPLPPLKQN